jgi:hypothetical protein
LYGVFKEWGYFWSLDKKKCFTFYFILSNSATQLQKQLKEQHSERWLDQTLHYLSDCQQLSNAANVGLVKKKEFGMPKTCPLVPSPKWLMTVYLLDVLSRLDLIKASITSVLGTVLKLDSTKKIAKKLAGHSRGTAAWVTNVGNEYGQVLMSVATASEGNSSSFRYMF